MTSFSLPPSEGRTVAVLGGGVLGRRITCGWAAGGHDVVIRDPNPEQRMAALHYETKRRGPQHALTITCLLGTASLN